jgi:FHA domain-containing protein
VITITVKSYNGTPLTQPLSAQFDELGGAIGRADNNQLVLPDPERTISRVHAQVVFRGGKYGIVDRGSNPISVNGRPLGNGQEAPLQPGDEVQIGGYALGVSAGAGNAAAVDPFADFGGLAATPAPMASRAPAAASGGYNDPLAGFGGAPSPAPARGGMGGGAPGAIPDDWDPFAPDTGAKARPDDFARSLGQPQGGFGLETTGRASAPLVPGMGGGGSESLDNLFGLGPSTSSSDPLANSALGAIDAAPNMAANSADPMKSLNSINRTGATAAADVVPELNTPFTLPTAPARAAPPPPAPRAAPTADPFASFAPAPAAAARPAAPPVAKGAVLSWDAQPEGQTIIRPKGARSAPPAAPALPPPAAIPAGPLDLDDLFAEPLLPAGAPAPVAAPVMPAAPAAAPALPDFDDLLGGFGAPSPAPAAVAAAPVAPRVAAAPDPLPAPPPPVAAAPVVAAPLAAPRAVPPPAGGADHAELLAALREGLKMPTLQMDTLTPEFMKLIGQLVHESTRGTVDLLVARAALKREIRAEMTMIVAKENNPLKFSPSVEVALNHLLSPPARGFMPADRAMRDAYDDLRAHQFGFLAGLRAALDGIIKRFDPATLEGKLTQKKSMLGTLLPAGRKAKLWDVFQELYGQISTEAEDDFHELFGKEFLKAYESYIDKLDQERR